MVTTYELLLSPGLSPPRLSTRPPGSHPAGVWGQRLAGAQGETSASGWRAVPGSAESVERLAFWALGTGRRRSGWRRVWDLGTPRPHACVEWGPPGRCGQCRSRGGARALAPDPRWHPSPVGARPRRSGRGPAARALPGGGCCDGETAAEPEPRSQSHLRHLGLKPPRAGRSQPGLGPAPAADSRPPAARRQRSPLPVAAQ